MGKYIEWIKDNWQKSAILVLIYVLASIIPLYPKIALIEFMVLLAAFQRAWTDTPLLWQVQMKTVAVLAVT